MSVLQQLELAVVDAAVAHASGKSHAGQAAKTSGWTAARSKQARRTQFEMDGQIMLLSNMCRLGMRRAGTWARRR